MRNILLPLLLACAATAPAGCATSASDAGAGGVLRSVTAGALAGEWRIGSINERVVADRAFSLDFAPDGRLTGTLNCNTLSGTYRIEGGALRFDVDQTALGCSGGESERLERAGRAVWTASRAGLSDDGRTLVFEGAQRVVFRRGG